MSLRIIASGFKAAPLATACGSGGSKLIGTLISTGPPTAGGNVSDAITVAMQRLTSLDTPIALASCA